jgi:hypothetical protein
MRFKGKKPIPYHKNTRWSNADGEAATSYSKDLAKITGEDSQY